MSTAPAEATRADDGKGRSVPAPRPDLALTLSAGAMLLAGGFMKLWSAACSVFRFGRPLAWGDALALAAPEAAIALAAVACAWGLRRWKGWASAAASYALAAALWPCVFITLLGGHVFALWGAFPEPHHLEALRRSGVQDAVWDVVFGRDTWPAWGAWLLCLGLALGAARLLRGSASAVGKARRAVTAVALALVVAGAARHGLDGRPGDPALRSPLVNLIAPAGENTDGLPAHMTRPQPPVRRGPPPPPDAPVTPLLEAGVAAGADVIFVVLESVRRSSVSFYGYPRVTTPHFDRMAEQSLVFQNAYVGQPRSCKTMESLALGVVPDPRLRSLTWKPQRLAGHDSLFRVLDRAGYDFYFGNGQDNEGDGFALFVRTMAGASALKRMVTRRNLLPRYPDPDSPDIDGALVDDFLKWYGAPRAAGRKTAAILWTRGAHYPYGNAPYRPFPQSERNGQAAYDNSVYSVDAALGRLRDGIAALGREKNVLFLVFGDHGEALGEHLECGHGSFLYDESVRVPFVIHGPGYLNRRLDVETRLQMKDVPRTLFHLLGIDAVLRQSGNVFDAASAVPKTLYFSNVYQDFKLGMLLPDGRKYMYRPEYDLHYLFDTKSDPQENRNIVGSLPPADLQSLRDEAVTWYFDQLDYLAEQFPLPPEKVPTK